jgi:ComF family protein
MTLSASFNTLLRLLYPEQCQICRAQPAAREDGYICQRCLGGKEGVAPVEAPFCGRCGLPFEGNITVEFTCWNCREHELHFRKARAAVQYLGVVREAIHRYKYNHHVWFERFLARLLCEKAAPLVTPADYDYIVPIPLHWTRRLKRSFNQAERLGLALSRATHVPLNSRLIRRRARTETQTRLGRKERALNMKRAFECRAPGSLKGLRLVLVDDVVTTGATASSCAKVLMDNGAALVDVWSVARNVLR